MNKPILAENLGNANQKSMTHLEIAELVQSRPDSVKRSIERLADKGVIRLPPLVNVEKINNLGHKVISETYVFEGEQGELDSITVVAQLCPEFTAALVKRWHELEKQVAGNVIAMPDFSNPPEAARAWANEFEAKQLAYIERDQAIATKAQISRTREATALGRLSAKSKEVDRLKMQLGESKEFATVAAVNNKLKTNFSSAEGRALSKFSKQNNISIRKAVAQDQRFSEVNSYHQKAWMAVFNIDLNSVFGA
jgi:hypothetical protein